MDFKAEYTSPPARHTVPATHESSGFARKSNSPSNVDDLAIEGLSISQTFPPSQYHVPQSEQFHPRYFPPPPPIQQQQQHQQQQQPPHPNVQLPPLQPRPPRSHEWDLYQHHQHQKAEFQQDQNEQLLQQEYQNQHTYTQPPHGSQYIPSQKHYQQQDNHPYAPPKTDPRPVVIIGNSQANPKVMTTITATIDDSGEGGSRSLSFEEARKVPKKKTSQQLSPAMAAKILTPAQQREAEADAYIQRAIELHEDNQLEEATYYFRLAAQSENPVGQLMYGLSLRHGWGCKANPKDALFYLQRAAEYAMSELKELNPSTSANVRVLQQHASRHQQRPPQQQQQQQQQPIGSSGHNNLALQSQPLSPTYAPPSPTHGTSALKRMNTVARKSATVTARKELVLALYELGMSFLKGWGVAKDKVIAFNYFKLAADLGDPDSQNETAQCFLDGIGTEKNNFEAARYFRMASAQGASQLGNSWIFKPKYDQYCETFAVNEAAASAARKQGQKILSGAGGLLSPTSPTGPMSSIAMGLAAATAGAVAPSAQMASSLPSKSWMPSLGYHHPNQSIGQGMPPTPTGLTGKADVRPNRPYSIAGDLISSSQLDLKIKQAEQLTHQTVLPFLNGQAPQPSELGGKKKHRWSLFPHHGHRKTPSAGY